MKTRFYILGAILLALVGMAFVFPVTIAKSSVEALACPGDKCVINHASENSQADIHAEKSNNIFCSTAYSSCDDCCNFCYNNHPDLPIIGNDCSCIEAQEYAPCMNR